MTPSSEPTPSDLPAAEPSAFASAILAAAILIGCVLIFIDAASFGYEARLFPRLIAVVGGISASVLLVQSILAARAEWNVKHGGPQSSLDWQDIVISYVTPPLYAAALYLFGFWIASVACLMGLMFTLGERRFVLMATITLGTLLTIYAVFTFGFSVRMPQGILIEMLLD